MIPSDQRPPGDDYLIKRITELERQVRELQSGRRLSAATISSGALRVVDANGNEIARLGDLGNGKQGVRLNRAGGIPGVAVYGTGQPGDSGFAALYDVSGNYLVTDDVASGKGLARPYIPLPVTEISAPAATTTSGSFVDLATGSVVVQHPVLYALLLVQTAAGTTGEVRLALDGTGIGPTATVAAATFGYAALGPFTVPSGAREPYSAQFHQLSVQARRTGGSGTIGVRPLSFLGLESSWA